MTSILLWAPLAWAATPRGVRVAAETPEGLDDAYLPRRVAMVVGVDGYADDQIPSLSYAARDAADVATVLQEPDLAAFDVIEVLSGQVDRDRFWGVFDTLTSTLEPDDTFLLYFAGHGTLAWTSPTRTELYLLPSDAVLEHVVDTAIPLTALDERIGSLRTQRRVVVLDTCYSGLGRSQHSAAVAATMEGLRGRAPIAPRSDLMSRYEARLYAADYHEPAREDATLGNGVYTHFLVEGLRSGDADLDGDGRVELLEAHWWAQQHTMSHTGQAQNPWMEVTQVGAEWLYLSEAEMQSPTSAILYAPGGPVPTRGASAPITVRVDGEDHLSGRLQPGIHRLQVEQGGAPALDVVLEIVPGERIDVPGLLEGSRGRTSVRPREAEVFMPRRRGWMFSLGAGLTSPATLGSSPGLDLRVVTSRSRPGSWAPAFGGVASMDLFFEDHPEDLRSRTSTVRGIIGSQVGGRWSATFGITFGAVWRPVWSPYWVTREGQVRDQATWAGGPTAILSAPLISVSEHETLGVQGAVDLLILPIDKLIRPVILGTVGMSYRL